MVFFRGEVPINELAEQFASPLFSPRGARRFPRPSASVQSAPKITVDINTEWIPHIIGVLLALDQPDTWDGTDEEIYQTRSEVRQLIAALAEGNPTIPGDGDVTTIIPYTQLDTSAESIELVVPDSYDVLELLMVLRTDRLAALDRISFMLNSDDGNNYRWWVAFLASAYRYDPYSPLIPLDILAGGAGEAGYFSTFRMSFVRGQNWFLNGDWYRREASNNGHIGQIEGMWKSNADISTITIEPLFGDFVAGCGVMLRGLS